MKVVIIEDEQIASSYLEKLIKEYDPSIQIIKKLDSVEASVAWLSANNADLLFVDIHLADDISFRIFEQIEITTPLIFTTAYDQYAIKAFKVNSIDYLLKPIVKEELFRALDKYKSLNAQSIDFKELMKSISSQQAKYQERFLVSTGQKLISVHIDSIAYFYSDQKLTFLTDIDGKQFIVENSLDKLESLLDPKNFFRINRQFIISFAAIRNMIAYSKSRVKIFLEPATDKEVIVSVERSSSFKEWLNK